MKLTLVIPVYNEANRVGKAITAINNYKSSSDVTIDVIFVDDGSTDNTVATIKSLSSTFPYQIISYIPNQGKGYALKQGILKASGDYILFLDADMSTPITELNLFLPEMCKNTSIIIGSRKTLGASVLKHQSFWRQKLGEGFTLMSSIILGLSVTDFTCGFKAFRGDAAKKIFGVQRIKRWGFDSEILFLAQKFGYAVKEIPVSWTNDERTKVNLSKDVWQSASDLIHIRWNDISGKYLIC
ncbi:MAG: glycosyltransferase family 2 protein [candidate division WWE3 bacterium]|nr:glycosyltransferase family 2 protein [candidate division WWE3 bacterium]